MTINWDPDKPETHPSLMGMNLDQLEAKLNEARDNLQRDKSEFGHMVMCDANRLIRMDLERVDTLRRAIKLKREEQGV